MKGTIALAAALLVVLGAIGLGHATARPDPKHPEIGGGETVEERLDRLQRQVNAQQSEIAAVRSQNNVLRAQVSNLIAINPHVSMVQLHGRPTVRFNGVNVQVVNGTGNTETSNGTGNLIVGYDRARVGHEPDVFQEECSVGTTYPDQPLETRQECEAVGGKWRIDHKSGSHYLVIGDWHNYTKWSGIVSGIGSTVNGRAASVTGGLYNRASNFGASVSGGIYAHSFGTGASVSGGDRGRAGAYAASVSGGSSGIARGEMSSVTGGYWNEASGVGASVSGGSNNRATNIGASVVGGVLNIASGYTSTVGGGLSRTAEDDYGWAAGD